MKRTPVLRSATQPTKFFTECIANLSADDSSRAIDFGCGYGRHAVLLADCGYLTVALDYDPRGLGSMRRPDRCPPNLLPVRCDLERGIPIALGAADVVVAIEYPNLRLLGEMAALVAVRGHLIMETFTARGGNWRDLPVIGSVQGFLEVEFEIIAIQEKLVGPDRDRSTVKAFARRRQRCSDY